MKMNRPHKSAYGALGLGAMVLCLLLVAMLVLMDGQNGDVAVYAHASEPVQPNIVLVIVDTVRADHLSSYGYTRTTTPNLDAQIAAQGVRFADVTSTAPWTSPSNGAMWTGMSQARMGLNWQNLATVLPDDAMTLAEYLRAAGYATAGFVNSVVNSDLGFGQGFDIYDSSHPSASGRWDDVKAETINSAAQQWLEDTWVPSLRGQKPLFLLLYYFDPHTWYDPPAPYDTLYDPDYTGTWSGQIFQHGRDVVSGVATPTERDIQHLKALYDGEIRYWDEQFGLFLTRLTDLGVLDNALIVVTSDHGELFGEHGKWLHRSSLHEESLRVPMLMRYTGVISPGLVIGQPVQNMDLMPTVLDYAGVPAPEDLDALNLRPLIEGQRAVWNRPILGELDAITDPSHPAFWLAPRVAQRSWRVDGWKLIHTLDAPYTEELYELAPEPLYEQDDQWADESARADAMRHDLYRWYAIGSRVEGKTMDAEGNPLPDVTVQIANGITATTGIDGDYYFPHLPPGLYTAVPLNNAQQLRPLSRTISVPPNAAGINFADFGGPDLFLPSITSRQSVERQ